MPASLEVNEIPADYFTPILLQPSSLESTLAKGYCHLSQIDWLQTVRGNCVLTLFYNKEFHYIPMRAGMEYYVEINPKTWHGALNFGPEAAFCYNLIFRGKRKIHPADYTLRLLPHPHNLALAAQTLRRNERAIWNPQTQVARFVRDN